MKTLRGTALYCGIGNTIEEMRAHLEQASSAGINAVFTSLQLPESNKEELLRDFPIMAEIAHSYGMIVDADVSERSADIFGLDMHDFTAFKKLGLDYLRMDYGYFDEEIVAASHNPYGITVELNAVHATDEWLDTLFKLGINKEQVHFCHNYYPMRYTGLKPEEVLRMNEVIHRHGFTVGGFLASRTHRRMACSIGLPTLERHRNMDVFAASQEAFLLGFDDLFFGDDFADISELKVLAEAEPGIVTFRMKPFVEGEIKEWLHGRVMEQTQYGLECILRSRYNSPHSVFPGYCDDTLSCERRCGDVTICKSSLLRYSGEIQLVRKDLPADPDIGLIGRIIDEDIPMLEIFRTDNKFRLICSEK